MAFAQAFPVPLSSHVWLLSSKLAARIKKLRNQCTCVFVSLQEKVIRCQVSRLTVYQQFNWSGRAKPAENKIRDDSGAALYVQTQKCKTQQLRVRILSPSRTRSRASTQGGTAKLFLHSFYWQLPLKVTHISRGAEFQEKKKKLASYVTSARSWQAPRNREAHRQETRTATATRTH